MGIQNSTRNLRSAGSFRGRFAYPAKTQNTTGNYPFLPNCHPFLSPYRQILRRWKFKTALEILEVPEFPSFRKFARAVGAQFHKRNWELAAGTPLTGCKLRKNRDRNGAYFGRKLALGGQLRRVSPPTMGRMIFPFMALWHCPSFNIINFGWTFI